MEHYHDPGPAKLVRSANTGERIDTFDFSQESEIDEVDPREEKIESLVEIICEAGDRPAAALLVLMATLENSPHPKVLINTATHFAFTRCSDLNLYGLVDSQTSRRSFVHTSRAGCREIKTTLPP